MQEESDQEKPESQTVGGPEIEPKTLREEKRDEEEEGQGYRQGYTFGQNNHLLNTAVFRIGHGQQDGCRNGKGHEETRQEWVPGPDNIDAKEIMHPAITALIRNSMR